MAVVLITVLPGVYASRVVQVTSPVVLPFNNSWFCLLEFDRFCHLMMNSFVILKHPRVIWLEVNVNNGGWVGSDVLERYPFIA